MTAYRRVITVTLALTALLVLVANLLAQAQETYLFIGILVAEAIGDVVATIYLAHITRSDPVRPRSWLLLFLLIGSACITFTIVALVVVTAARILGAPLDPETATTFIGTALVIGGAVPIMKAVLFWLVQRDAKIDGGVVVDLPAMTHALAHPKVAAALAAGDMAQAAERMIVILAAPTVRT